MDYKLATSTWDDKELKAIQQVIDSNNFTMGEKVSKYEEKFANFFNSYNVREEKISSKSVTVNVKELPEPKPKKFNGAVGSFEISSKVLPEASRSSSSSCKSKTASLPLSSKISF